MSCPFCPPESNCDGACEGMRKLRSRLGVHDTMPATSISGLIDRIYQRIEPDSAKRKNLTDSSHTAHIKAVKKLLDDTTH